MDFHSSEYFMLLIVTWYLSQMLPSEYDEGKPWHFVISTLFKKLAGTGEIKQDRRKASWRAVYGILTQKMLGQKTMTSEKSGVEF